MKRMYVVYCAAVMITGALLMPGRKPIVTTHMIHDTTVVHDTIARRVDTIRLMEHANTTSGNDCMLPGVVAVVEMPYHIGELNRPHGHYTIATNYEPLKNMNAIPPYAKIGDVVCILDN